MKNMKNMKKLVFLMMLCFVFSSGAFAQMTLPRESQRAAISQTIGDTIVSIVYHRPNTKGRKIWVQKSGAFYKVSRVKGVGYLAISCF